jgi:hypothetical protein
MFHKKIHRKVESLDTRIGYTEDYVRDKYYELRADIDRLVKALGMTKDRRIIDEYIKKGGPERGEQ